MGEPVQRVEGPEFEEVEVSEEEDDVDDMFALLGGEAPKKKKKIRVAKNGSGQMAPVSVPTL